MNMLLTDGYSPLFEPRHVTYMIRRIISASIRLPVSPHIISHIHITVVAKRTRTAQKYMEPYS